MQSGKASKYFFQLDRPQFKNPRTIKSLNLIHFPFEWVVLGGSLEKKRTVSVISSDPSNKDCNVRFSTVPLKPKSDQKCER